MTAGAAPRWARFAPGLHTLLHYDRRWLRGDLLAGVTVTAYLVPQVMAYAEIAGLPPIAGLWAILAPLAVYAVLGSSRQLSIGPESTTALLTAAGVGALIGAAGGPERWSEVAGCWRSRSAWCAWWPGCSGSDSWPTCSPDPCWSATWPGSRC